MEKLFRIAARENQRYIGLIDADLGAQQVQSVRCKAIMDIIIELGLLNEYKEYKNKLKKIKVN